VLLCISAASNLEHQKQNDWNSLLLSENIVVGKHRSGERGTLNIKWSLRHIETRADQKSIYETIFSPETALHLTSLTPLHVSDHFFISYSLSGTDIPPTSTLCTCPSRYSLPVWSTSALALPTCTSGSKYYFHHFAVAYIPVTLPRTCYMIYMRTWQWVERAQDPTSDTGVAVREAASSVLRSGVCARASQ